MNTANIKIYRAPGAKLPVYKTAGAAGCDFHAHFEGEYRETGKRLDIMERALIPTGIFMDLQELECQIRPRSGMAADHGITVLNSPGTIDGDYRGEIKILLINLGQEAYTIKHGERIAQGVIGIAIQGVWEEVASEAELSATARGKGGFGSTGNGLSKEEFMKQYPMSIAKAFAPENIDPDYRNNKFEHGPVDVKKNLTEEEAIEEARRLEAEYELDETANTFEQIKTIPTEEVVAQLNAADVNGDGKVDEKDLSIVHKEYHEQKKQGGDDTAEREADEKPVADGNGEAEAEAPAPKKPKAKRSSKRSTDGQA